MRTFKKTGLIIAFIILLIFVSTLTASAENENTENPNDKLYQRVLEKSGAAELDSLLPDNEANILKDLGFDFKHSQDLFKISEKGVLETLFGFFKNGFTAPLKTCLTIIGVLLIFASFSGILGTKADNMSLFVCFVSAIISTAPIFSIMEAVKSTIQSLCTFMLGLVPVYAGVAISAGKTSATGGFSALLLLATEAVSYLISYFFIPISGAVICLSICGGLSPALIILRLTEWIKKAANWTMGIATTLFLGVLSVQNSFLTVADGVGLRTSKAVIGTAIPIMGPAIAETVGTATSCLNLLSSSVGIYAVLAVSVLTLPIIIELFLWRVSMWVCSAVCDTFGMPQMEKILKSIDFGLSVLLSAMLFTSLLFIIALTITIKG
jgi:stage III sporulation protein AE